ncbi:MAG TPA: hypothetical protein VFY73_30205 [Ideonella sp.]|uniref:hypothetical protein n=1 Tax=Ideonella sp. TaxID=1929293 RepID=UPI002E30201C|nr:hypothetical protein [Ideonella sp.]HEX5688314.1 hypothetical protein [Ideonella sp.]
MRIRKATARQCLAAVAVLVGWWWYGRAEAAPCRFVGASLPSDTQRGVPCIGGSGNGGAIGTSLTRTSVLSP